MKTSAFKILLVVLCFSVGTAALAKKITLSGANKLAVKLYKADKNKSAKKILNKILDRNTDYQPSNILMGKILADEGEYKKAADFFARAGSFAGSSPLSYQAGLAFYEVGKCKAAIGHLKRVNKRSILFEDAQVYRAACLARLSRPERALRVLQKAKQTSPGLKNARRRLFTELSRQIRQNRDSRIVSRQQNFQVVYVPAQNHSVKNTKKHTKKLYTKSKKKKKVVYTMKPKARGFYRQSSPRLAFEYVSKSNDIHGFEVEKSKETFFHAGMISLFGYEYLINKIYKGSFDGRSEIQFINRNKSGSIITNVADPGSPNNLAEDVTDSEESTFSRLRTMFSPQARIPISKSFYLLLPFSYENYWNDPPPSDFSDTVLEKTRFSYGAGLNIGAGPVDFTTLYRRMSVLGSSEHTFRVEQNATASLSKTWEKFNAFLDVNYIGRSLFSGEPLPGPATEIAANMKLSFLLESISVDLAAKYIQRSSEDPETITVSGPDFGAESVVGAELAVKGTLVESLDLSGTFVYESQQNYNLAIEGYTPSQMGANGSVTANGTTLRILGKLAYIPIPNISFQTSYEHVRSTWTTLDPMDQSRFETVQGNLQNNFAISVEAKMTF